MEFWRVFVFCEHSSIRPKGHCDHQGVQSAYRYVENSFASKTRRHDEPFIAVLMTTTTTTTVTTTAIRGIHNYTGVSCHLSAALQIICHSIVPLRCALIHIANNTLEGDKTIARPDGFETLILLGRFFRELTTTSTATAVDPTSFYDQLTKTTTLRLDPNQLGDATVAARTILELVLQCIKELETATTQSPSETLATTTTTTNSMDINDNNYRCWSIFLEIMEQSIGGTVIQALVGKRTIRNDDIHPHSINNVKGKTRKTIQIQRQKTKTRSMACPFPLPAMEQQQHPNYIIAALRTATILPRRMYGYNWDKAHDYQEEETVLEEEEDGDDEEHQPWMVDLPETELAEEDWETYQTVHFQSLPFHVMFQLQPFVYRNGRIERRGRRVELVQSQQHANNNNNNNNNVFVVPLTFDMPKEIFTSCSDGKPYDMHHEGIMSCSDDGCRCTRWMLQAAVLHIDVPRHEDEHVDDGDDDELGGAGGHYVCLIKENHVGSSSGTTTADPSVWSLVDDDQVTTVSITDDDEQDIEQLLRYFDIAKHSGDSEEAISPTLLSFSRHCTCGIKNQLYERKMDEFVTELKSLGIFAASQGSADKSSLLVKCDIHNSSSNIDWSKPTELVGRRLRIRWATGKFYSGVVASYDSTSGKHRVQYKDGDVRDYCLAKKTIDWES
jgi:hypothetical protein